MHIKNLEIKKLFGRFDYFFSFETGQNNLFMFHGHNGSGKTKVLSIIDTLCRKDFMGLEKLNCEYMKLTYSNGEALVVKRRETEVKTKTKRGHQGALSFHEDSFEISKIDSDGQRADVKKAPKTREEKLKARRVSGGALNHIEAYLPFLVRVGHLTWNDRNTGENISVKEIVALYDDSLPHQMVEDIIEAYDLSMFQANALPTIRTKFINTRRLDYANFFRSQMRDVGGHDSNAEIRNPLLALSKKISGLLASCQSQYAARSQQLDSKFPRSILMPDIFYSKDKQTVSGKLKRLNDKSQSLYEAGILDEQDTLAINLSALDDSLVSILDKYCVNTEDKLSVFEDIYRKINLLTEIINRRFNYKHIKIAKSGIVVVDSENGQDIPLEALSSGEQHELYLFADLIFSADVPDAILIDEPEISLHVEWQESFVNDLLRIETIRDSQIFIATHSPSIIGTHWDKAFDLAAQQQKGSEK